MVVCGAVVVCEDGSVWVWFSDEWVEKDPIPNSPRHRKRGLPKSIPRLKKGFISRCF